MRLSSRDHFSWSGPQWTNTDEGHTSPPSNSIMEKWWSTPAGWLRDWWDHALFQHPVNSLLQFWEKRMCYFSGCVQTKGSGVVSELDWIFLLEISQSMEELGKFLLEVRCADAITVSVPVLHKQNGWEGHCAGVPAQIPSPQLLYPSGRVWQWRHPERWEECYLVLEGISLQVWVSLISPCFLRPLWLMLQYQVWSLL